MPWVAPRCAPLPSGSGAHHRTTLVASALTLVTACVLVMCTLPSSRDGEGSVQLTEGPPGSPLDGARLGGAAMRERAKVRLAVMASRAPHGAGGQRKDANMVLSKVKEAAKERMLQLSAMIKQQSESKAAVSNAVNEVQQYNVLGIRSGVERHPIHARTGATSPGQGDDTTSQNDSPREAAQDAVDELARYSRVAASGADAYAEDKQFMGVEEKRSQNPANKVVSKPVPVLGAASHLLARYSRLANAGVAAYRSDSKLYQANAASTRESESSLAASSATREATSVHVGAAITVLSPTLRWRAARVDGIEAGQVLAHYDGYKHKYDEWIPLDSHRIRGVSHHRAQAQPQSMQGKVDKAKAQVAREFSEYAQIASSGQQAYHHDLEAAAQHSHRQQRKARAKYAIDEAQGAEEAKKTADRYSKIARLGTPQDEFLPASLPHSVSHKQAESPQNLDWPQEAAAVSKANLQFREPSMSDVKSAAQAAANAAASVVSEANAAVREVEGTRKSVLKKQPQEHARPASDVVQQGRGRIGSSTERTYSEVNRQLVLAAQTAQAEGNIAVGKEVADEQRTLERLRKVPGSLPMRVQHNLVSAGASLLRRLGLGAAARDQRTQAKPLKASRNNAVLSVASGGDGSDSADPREGPIELSVASTSERPVDAVRRAMMHLHQKHARARARQLHAASLWQRLLEQEAKTAVETKSVKATNVDNPARFHKATVHDETKPIPETSAANPVARLMAGGGKEGSDNRSKGPFTVDLAKTVAEDGAAKLAGVQPGVSVTPPLGVEHEEGQEVVCDVACQLDRRRRQSDEEYQQHVAEDSHTARVESHTSHGDEPFAAKQTADGCWIPDLPQTREALCTPAMYKDGTCELVWGDVPEITGAVEAFALKRVYISGDSSKLHLQVLTAPSTRTPLRKYGFITAGYQKRSDGALWQYESRPVASSAPWSTIGFFQNAPDMLVKDCEGEFLGVISMDPAQEEPSVQALEAQDHLSSSGGGEAGVAEAKADTGVAHSEQKRATKVSAVRARIQGPTGKESLTVINAASDVLGDNVGALRYHVYVTDTRRLVGVMQRRSESDHGKLDWVIRMEKDGPLDIRVMGILAAQIEAETMRKATDYKEVILTAATVLIGLVLFCCFLPIPLRRWSQDRLFKVKSPLPVAAAVKPDEAGQRAEMELPHTAGAPAPDIGNMSSRSSRSAEFSLASSYARTAGSRGMTARSDVTDFVLATERSGELSPSYGKTGDLWRHLPPLEEYDARDRDYYQSASLGVGMVPSKLATQLDEDEQELQIRAVLADVSGSKRGSLSTTPRGWEATSFRDTQRSSHHQDGMDIRDVLDEVLQPMQQGDNLRLHGAGSRGEGVGRPKSLREWAEKYNFHLPTDDK